jgi:hypothetical protein
MIKDNPFWKYFVFISLVVVLFLVIIYQFESFKQDILLSIAGFLYMEIATAGFYLLSLKALKSTNKMAFIQLVMFNVIFKIVGFMIITAIYFKLVHPAQKFFVIPFLIIYFIYTIFETIFIYNLSLKKS